MRQHPALHIPEETTESEPKSELTGRTIAKHVLLFVLTFISCAVMSSAFSVGRFTGSESWTDNIMIIARDGGLFASLLLGFLGVHEFGHYFAAVKHRVKTSLPFFIPLPIISPIGTIGAVIRIKEQVRDTVKLFDIGIAGPIAGFIVSLGILIWGFETLPGPEFLEGFPGHETTVGYVQDHGTFPADPPEVGEGQLLMLGNTLLYGFIASFYDNAPPLWEAYHYPFLFAGWLGLFFTALNLMPVGQLDGGHILFGLVGYRRHKIIARLFFGIVISLGSLGVIPPLVDWLSGHTAWAHGLVWSAWALIIYMLLHKAYRGEQLWISAVMAVSMIASALMIYVFLGIENVNGYTAWILFALFLVFLVRIEHPPVTYNIPLTRGRKILGWITMAIFLLCISPNPLYLV
ncbi:MAG: site-2 protease family protein [Rhodothermaceae bacterium]|nr:site-2 protease family protein [Rhodothermaceae bacterium]